MTQPEIAIQQAAELAAGSAVDAFGEDIPNAQTAWDFINDQIYAEEEKRPLHLPLVMPNGFGPLYLVAAAKLIRERAQVTRPAIDPTQRLIHAVVAVFDRNPGHSDLDDEQPIYVKMTLGDYRLACRLRSAAPGEYGVTFLAEDGRRTILGNQPPMDEAAAADMARRCNEQDSTAEARAERV